MNMSSPLAYPAISVSATSGGWEYWAGRLSWDGRCVESEGSIAATLLRLRSVRSRPNC